LADRLTASPTQLERLGLKVNQDGVRRSLHEILRYPGVSLDRLAALWPELGDLDPVTAEQIEIDGHYAIYLQRQEKDVAAYRRDEALKLPNDLDYGSLPGISNEMRDILETAHPATLGAAARLPGVTPAALVLLLRHVKRRKAPDGSRTQRRARRRARRRTTSIAATG
jgi:tRNA uridine 5-carboxymethylaminomethyl modification enzyme